MDNNLPLNNQPPDKPTLWEANPKLKTLLLILIFVFLGCGIGLVVFAQWQNQYQQQIYTDTQAALPKHQPSATSLKSFASQTGAIQFQYPSSLTVAETNGIVTVNHNISYENHGECDMKGDSRTYPTLNDFNVAIQIISKSVAQSVKQFSPYMPPENFSGESLKISPGFIDQAEIGQYKGFAILEGVEGCGHVIYYFPIANNQTLVVIKDNVQMLSNIVVAEVRDAILKVPGVITPEQSDVIFKQIVSSLKLSSTSSQNDVTGWKIYTNSKFGFEFRYPQDWSITANGNLFQLYGPNADLASINIKYYSSLNDLPSNPTTNKSYDNFEQYIMDQHFFKNQNLVFLNDGTSESAVSALDPSIHVMLIGGNQHFYELNYQPRYNQTLDQLEQIIKTFKFTK